MANFEFGLVIPCYNFESGLPHTLERIKKWREASGLNSVVCVVDDGSSDCTAKIAEEFAGKNQGWFRSLRLPRNQGKGYAIRCGAEKIAGLTDYLVFTDCDLHYGLDIISARVLPALKSGSDIAIIDRSWSKQFHRESPVRSFVSRAFNHVKSIATGVHFNDSQAGLKGFHSDIARAIFKVSRIRGFAFDVEFLCIAILHRLKVEQIPIRDVVRSGNTASSIKLKSVFQMVLELLEIAYLRYTNAYRIPELEERVERNLYTLKDVNE